MNKSKFGRHIGVGKNYHGELPSPQVTMDVGRLAGAPLYGGSGGTAPSYAGSIIVDPPVGGFNAGDMLFQAPNVSSHATIIAAQALDNGSLFAPGHYHIQLHAVFASVGGTPDLVWQALLWKNGGWTPPMGNSYPEWPLALVSASVQYLWHDTPPVYFPDPWALRLITLNAMGDTAIVRLSCGVYPVHLLDDGPSQV